jgi:hypothetical protein
VCDQLYITAALLLEQETLCTTQEDAWWAPEPVWTLRGKFLPFLGIEPQFYACSEQHEKKDNNIKHQLSWKYIGKGGGGDLNIRCQRD